MSWCLPAAAGVLPRKRRRTSDFGRCKSWAETRGRRARRRIRCAPGAAPWCRGAAGGQEGRDISGDRNLFGGTTHFEREIDYRALTGHEGCFALPILHTWGGYGEAIVAGRQRRKHEKAGLISDGLEAVVGLNVFEEDGGIRYYSPTAMENSALNLAHAGLGAHERGQHTQTQSK